MNCDGAGRIRVPGALVVREYACRAVNVTAFANRLDRQTLL